MSYSNLYHKIGKWIFHHPWPVLAISLLISTVGAFGTLRIAIKADLQNLLPDSFESVRGLQALKETYGGMGYLTLGIEASRPEDAIRFMNDLAPDLSALPEVRYVNYRRPVEFFMKRFPLYLDGDDLKEIERRLESKREAVRHGANPIFDKLFFSLDDDLDFDDILKKYENRFNLDPFSTEYFQNEEGTFFALLIKPAVSNTDFAGSRHLVEQVQQAVNRHPPSQYGSGLKISFGGEYQNALEQEDHLRNEIGGISLIVLILLMLVVILYYRRLSAVVVIGLPLLVGIFSTGGVVYLLLGHVNLVTGFSAAVLAGLGSDYGIYLLTRFFQERESGHSLLQSYFQTFFHTRKATRGSAVTTMIAFGALFFSQFKGFSEFGLIGLIGIGLNYFFMYFLFPALLVLLDRHQLFAWERKFFPWSLKMFLSPRRLRWALSCGVISFCLLVVSATQISKVMHVEYDLKGLANTDLPSYQTDQRVNALFHDSLTPTVLTVSTEAEEEKVLAAVSEMAHTPSAHPMIRGGVGLSSFVPKDQKEKWPRILHIQQLLQQIRLPVFVKNKSLLKAFLSITEDATVAVKDLPIEIQRLWSGVPSAEDLPPNRFVFVFSSGSRNSTEKVVAFADQIHTVAQAGTGVTIASDVLIVSDILHLVSLEAPWILALIFLLFFFELAFEFKSVRSSLHLSLMLLFVLIFLCGGMALFRLRFNFFNLAAVPIIFGTGCDSFIHFYQRYREHQHQVLETLNKMIPSIVIANLTTMIGFGGLIATDNAALRSVGWLVILGMSVVTITALVVFPALLALNQQLRKK